MKKPPVEGGTSRCELKVCQVYSTVYVCHPGQPVFESVKGMLADRLTVP